MEWLKRWQEILSGKIPKGVKRSPHWPEVRGRHLRLHPECALCGGTKKLNVHHVRPFWLFPELELAPLNLITLCEGSRWLNCHFVLGHLLSWKSFNLFVLDDIRSLRMKILRRPDTRADVCNTVSQ